VQVQQWQHLGHRRRLAYPRGHDRRGEPLPLPGGRASIGSSLTLTSPWLPQSTPRVARFEVTTGVGLAPVSPTKPLVG
jgi:hypothetical protein